MFKKLLIFILITLIIINVALIVYLLNFNQYGFRSINSKFSFKKGEIKYYNSSTDDSLRTLSIEGKVYKTPYFENSLLILPIEFSIKNKKIKS